MKNYTEENLKVDGNVQEVDSGLRYLGLQKDDRIHAPAIKYAIYNTEPEMK